MDLIQVVILLALGVSILMPLLRLYGRKVQTKRIVGKLSPPGFKMTQGVMGVDRMSGLSFDETNRKICLVAITDGAVRQRVVDFKNILSSEIFENGTSITRTVRSSQIAGTIIGGLALGGVGAIIGGLSGKTESKNQTERIDLRLLVNDIANPVHDVAFYIGARRRAPTARDRGMQDARHWHGIVEILIRRADEADKQPDVQRIDRTSTSPSVADELKKLVELRDSGAPTAEEFQQQKTRLLSASH